jgi:hypothetical protein
MLKNFGDLNVSGVVVNETATSRHDTTSIGEMFYLLKSNFKKKFGLPPKFRIIGMDLSWATIHAALEMFNMETVEEYAKRIYEYSQSTAVSEEFTKSFLASCCSHTMHRFTRAIKRQVTFLNKEHRNFAALCFSLLLNTLDLDSTKEIFKLMCTVFLNEKYSSQVDEAK